MTVLRQGLRAVVMDRQADAYAQALGATFPEVEFLTGQTPEEVIQFMPRAHLLIALAPYVTRAMLRAGTNLEWIQALTTGVDNLLQMPELKPEILLTNTRGIHGPQMSEMAFLYMLALARDWRGMQENQAYRIWDRKPQRLLWRRTLVIVGVGAIAEDLARRAKAFEMTVVGVSGHPRALPAFDEVVARGQMREALARADFVVVLAPYSSDTHHMIDAPAIAAMRKDSYLINLARGGVVDEDALMSALDSSQIAGAGLDVFLTEPLPFGSRWWSHPKVLLTPHVGGMSDVYEAQVMPIVEDNLAAFLRGRPDTLENIVVREAAGAPS